MKRQIKKIALLIIAILGVNYVNAQTDFSLHLGMLFPQGNFAESRMDNQNVAWLTKSNRAGAGLGFDAGMKFRFNVPSVKGLGIIATADFFLNMPNDDVKSWKEDIVDSYYEYSDLDEITISLPHYINIPIMVGANYEYAIKNNIKVWAEAGLGLNIGTLTDFKMLAEFSDEGDYLEEKLEGSYQVNTSMAFQVGAGIMFNSKYSFGVHYYELGSQKIKGKQFEDEIYNGESINYDEWRFTGKSIVPGMLTIRLGYHF